jgi:hypothetical protein
LPAVLKKSISRTISQTTGGDVTLSRGKRKPEADVERDAIKPVSSSVTIILMDDGD